MPGLRPLYTPLYYRFELFAGPLQAPIPIGLNSFGHTVLYPLTLSLLKTGLKEEKQGQVKILRKTLYTPGEV
jgi:hypothetical protein